MAFNSCHNTMSVWFEFQIAKEFRQKCMSKEPMPIIQPPHEFYWCSLGLCEYDGVDTFTKPIKFTFMAISCILHCIVTSHSSLLDEIIEIFVPLTMCISLNQPMTIRMCDMSSHEPVWIHAEVIIQAFLILSHEFGKQLRMLDH